MVRLLFWLCWIVYFSTYIGRLNYSASLTEIITSEGFSKGQAGMIGTAFFLPMEQGQFVSGFLGDHLAPKKMVFTGLLVSGLCNLAMAGVKAPRADGGGLVCKAGSGSGVYLVAHDPADV